MGKVSRHFSYDLAAARLHLPIAFNAIWKGSDMSERILRRPAVEERSGLGRSTIYDYMARGLFPQPIRLGERAVGWRESDINSWIESRLTTASAGASSHTRGAR